MTIQTTQTEPKRAYHQDLFNSFIKAKNNEIMFVQKDWAPNEKCLRWQFLCLL